MELFKDIAKFKDNVALLSDNYNPVSYNEILIHWREDCQNFIRYWNNVFQQTARGEIDTWDHQWTFACWNQKGLW